MKLMSTIQEECNSDMYRLTATVFDDVSIAFRFIFICTDWTISFIKFMLLQN